MADVETKANDEKAKDCENILKVLEKIRLPYEAMIDNILTYVHHGRRKITDKESQKGQKTGIEVYDSTALQALNLLADGLSGYSISRSFRWFEYTLPGKLNFPRTSGMRAWNGKRVDEYPDVKNWLESCEEVMYSAFLRSNLYDVASDMIKDAASVGTVSPMIEEDVGQGRIIFTIPHFREVFIAENRYGQVDTHYRSFKLTYRQLVDKFGMDKMVELKPDFKEKYKKNIHEELEVLHAVYPRADFDPDKVNKKNKPVASMWILRSPLKLIEESGYDENPCVSWRWRKNNDEWYGRSPAWDAYVDVMTANQQGKTNLIAGHKMVDPPMVAPADLRGMVQTGPKGWTFIDGLVTKDRMPMPLITGIQLPYSQEQQDRMDQKIKEHFHTDFFLMLSQASENKVEMTATQVLEMSSEKAAVLGPRIGRMESEAMNPIQDRVFAIERRAGRIPDPPEILMEYSGGNIEIDYLGPLSQAQKKLFKSQGIRGGIESLAPLAAIHPQVIDVIDPDETARILLESTGFPSKAIRNKADVDEIRQQKIEQAEAEQAAQEALDAGKVLPKLGKTVEDGSLLADMKTMGNA